MESGVICYECRLIVFTYRPLCQRSALSLHAGAPRGSSPLFLLDLHCRQRDTLGPLPYSQQRPFRTFSSPPSSGGRPAHFPLPADDCASHLESKEEVRGDDPCLAQEKNLCVEAAAGGLPSSGPSKWAGSLPWDPQRSQLPRRVLCGGGALASLLHQFPRAGITSSRH